MKQRVTQQLEKQGRRKHPIRAANNNNNNNDNKE